MTQKITVSPFVDLTARMTGTTAKWSFTVSAVYVNGVSTAFSWSDGTLTIGSYVSGVVLAQFDIYLIYDAPSQYLPSDPTNPASTQVFWENRLSAFFSVSNGIKSFETGLSEVQGGNIGILISSDDNSGWLDLINELIIWSNRTIRIYNNDVIAYKGITTKQTLANFGLTVQVQKRQTILESDVNWGDPDYLNRIDLSSNTAYYNGANIPTKCQGQVIPMLFGDQFPYEQTSDSEIDIGTPAPTFLVPPGTKRSQQGVDTSMLVKVIPTSSTTGILGRMPSYQSISSVPINQALTGAQHNFSKTEQGSNSVIMNNLIPGCVCTLERTSGGSPIVNSARLYNRNATRGLFFLGADDPTYTNYDLIRDCNQNIHMFPDTVPTTAWTAGAILSGTFTPGGHRWLTISSITGIDLLVDDLYVVITNINGARTASEVCKFALESHGYTVEPTSFAALATALPYKTVQMAGSGTSPITLASFIQEINQSLMMVVVFPASNDAPFLIKIDPTKAAQYTIVENQILNLTVNSEYRDQAKNVTFSPKYAKSDAQKTSLFRNITASMSSLFLSTATTELNHVLNSVPSTRFSEMTEIYGSPDTDVSFTMLDDSQAMELADCVQINHTSFNKKILITSISTLPVGRSIQGRYLYVNQN